MASASSAGIFKELSDAIHFGDVKKVKELLARRVNFNIVSSAGTNLLHSAAMNGNPEIVQALINAKVNMNRVANDGNTPLLLAVMWGHKEAVDVFLAAGADVRVLKNGSNLLHFAAKSGNPEIVKALLDKKVDANKINNAGESPLLLAANGGYTEIVRLLLDHGADGSIVLYRAALASNIEVVRMLIEQGADIMHPIAGGPSFIERAEKKEFSLAVTNTIREALAKHSSGKRNNALKLWYKEWRLPLSNEGGSAADAGGGSASGTAGGARRKSVKSQRRRRARSVKRRAVKKH